MRLFIIVLYLVFCLHSWVKADDISEFEIEGMSIGDSLLNHFNQNEINNELNSEYVFKYKSKFIKVAAGNGKDFYLIKKSKEYDDIGIALKIDDTKYIIYGLSGRIFCDSGIDICLNNQKNITSDLKKFFAKKVDFDTWKEAYPDDPSGKSIVYGNDFKFKESGDIISVHVYDYSDEFFKKTNFPDHTAVTIFSKEYYNFIQNEAYD